MLIVTSDSKKVMAAIRQRIRDKIQGGQRVLTLECKKHADFFTPRDKGQLRDSFRFIYDARGVKIGWMYLVPYAWKQWKGITDSGKPFNYSIIPNPHARSEWGRHGVATYKEAILRKVRKEMSK